MKTDIDTEPEEPETSQPWDFVGIIAAFGPDGLRARYRNLAQFARLLNVLGNFAVQPPEHWYRYPDVAMTLAALQAQWNEVCNPSGKPWVASQFWTREMPSAIEVIRTSDLPSAFDNKTGLDRITSLNQYLQTPQFAQLCKQLDVLGREADERIAS